MKTLGNTFWFQHSKVKDFKKQLAKINFDTEKVSLADLEDNIKTIRRRFTYSLKTQTLLSLEQGKIICIYPVENNLTKLIPVFLKADSSVDGGIVAVINIRLYATKDKLGNYDIDNRQLYGLLEDAYIYREMWLNQRQFEYNTTIMQLSTNIYVKLMNKIFDKWFGLNLSPLESDQINYTLGKFFLLNVIEKSEGDIVNDMAYKAIFNDTPKTTVTNCDTEFSNDAYMSIDTYFDNLKKTFPIVSKINIREFMLNWMTMFGESTLFATEYYPSLLEAVFCGAVIGCRLTAKDAVFDNVVGREALKLHTEVSRLLQK